MFEDLRRAFREAVDNFRTELRRDDVPEAVDRLLHGMREELTDSTAHLRKLEEDVQRARAQASREEEAARTCLRRQKMAEDIADEETARLAEEYARRHLERKEVLEGKARALGDEVRVRRAEIEEMTARLKRARAERDGLAATAGRSDARATLDDAEALFRDLDLMEERIEDADRLREAEAELEAAMGGTPPPPTPEPDPVDAEERLRELKRRMGEG